MVCANTSRLVFWPFAFFSSLATASALVMTVSVCRLVSTPNSNISRQLLDGPMTLHLSPSWGCICPILRFMAYTTSKMYRGSWDFLWTGLCINDVFMLHYFFTWICLPASTLSLGQNKTKQNIYHALQATKCARSGSFYTQEVGLFWLHEQLL